MPSGGANQKFIEWLEEMQRQADQSQNKNLYFVYRKALASLKKESAALSVTQLSRLNGIGPSIQKKLEDRQRQFLAEDPSRQLSDLYAPGSVLPADLEISSSNNGQCAPVRSATSSLNVGVQRATRSAPVSIASLATTTSSALSSSSLISDLQTASNNINSSQPSQSQTLSAKVTTSQSRQTRKYVPGYRSGGYAIIMALYKHYLDNDRAETFLTRSDIVAAAQSYTDTSFNSGGVNSSSGGAGGGIVGYSAWSSMSTLITKGLVMKRGVPARFCLTDEGIDMGGELWNKTESFHLSQQSSEGEPLSDQPVSDIVHKSKAGRKPKKAAVQTATIVDAPSAESVANQEFLFEYVDSCGKRVLTRDYARIKISSEDFTSKYQIIFSHALLNHPFCDNVDKNGLIVEGGLVTGYLNENVSPPIAPGLSSAIGNASSIPSVISQRLQNTPLPSQIVPPVPVSQMRIVEDDSISPWPQTDENILSDSNSSEPLDWINNQIILRPGNFDVVLLIDQRENRAAKDKEFIESFLEKQRIPFEYRVLEVGDFMWIARPKERSQAYNELVLDLIVERKRLDDLVSSIKSGRFVEQKTRLCHSGLSNIWYLIEDFHCSAVEDFGADRVRSAIAEMQIDRSISVHRVSSFEESADFLMNMHRLLAQEHSGKEIRGVPYDALRRKTFLQTLHQAKMKFGVKYHIPFGSFGLLNTKSKSMTMKELWFRQLYCIRGISPDKALSIVNEYPTFRSLMISLLGCQTNNDRVKLFRSIGAGKAAAKDSIGLALARKLVEFFCAEEYSTALSE